MVTLSDGTVASTVVNDTSLSPFTLTAGLANVVAAESAVTAFIESNTIDINDPEDGVGDGNAAEITVALTTAAGLLDTAIETTAVVASGFESDSVTLRAALLSDANADLAAQLVTAEATLATKQAVVTADLAFQTADATYDINAASTVVASYKVRFIAC